MISLYTFNETKLDYEKLSLKPLLLLPIVFVLAVLSSYLFFRAELIETWEWKLAGKKLKKETVKLTIYEWISD